MQRYETTRDVTVRYRGDYDVDVPKGTQVIKLGENYAVYAPMQLPAASGPYAGLFKHDATYFYVWVPAEAVAPAAP
jgi:hypothetical protein